MALDPNHTTTTTTATVTATTTIATTTTAITNTTRPIRPAVSPSASSPPVPPNLYTTQSLPMRTQSPSAAAAAAHHHHPNHHPNHHHNHQGGQGVLFPVASSGRGFIPRAIRPATAERAVTVANAGGGLAYPSRPLLNFPPPQQPSLPVHLMRPAYNLQPSPLPPPVRGLPLSATPEAAPPSLGPDSNGFKDIRDKSRDDNLAVIRGRKVRMTEGASLYVHCRSWLRNGFPEEIQPQYGDVVRSLPKPSPLPTTSATLPKKEEEEEQEESNEGEDEEYVKHLSPDDLLKRHVKRARKVRARLREERLGRIARYKSRLALLLPPLVEQFRNDLAAGN